MRRFELTEGTSSKFWEVQREGCDVTVRFGRIGTGGQTKTKTFASDAAAQKEHDALVKEKTGKGYGEVTVGTGATPGAAPTSAAPAATSPSSPSAAPAAPAAPATKASKAASMTATTSGPSPTPRAAAPSSSTVAARADASVAEGLTPTASLEWPHGGFVWNDEWRRKLPIVRGVHAPPLPDGKSLLVDPIAFDDDRYGYYASGLDELAKAAVRPWTYWGEARSKQLIRRDVLARPDPEFWLELIVQAAASPFQARALPNTGLGNGTFGMVHGFMAVHWVCCVGVALHGIAFMVERALDAERIAHKLASARQTAVHGLLVVLRQAIAASDDGEHDTVIALLESQAGSTPLDRRVRACLCPHRRDWVEASAAEGSIGPHSLKDCVMSVDALLNHITSMAPWYPYAEGPLALQFHLHGDAAFAVLADLLRRTRDRSSSEQFVALAMRAQVPAMVPLFAELIERKEVRAALDKLGERYPAAVLSCVAEHAHAARSSLAEGWAVRLALKEPAALAQALPALSPAARQQLEAALAQLQRAEAPVDALPQLLRDPPWLRKTKPIELPVLDMEPMATPAVIRWSEDERRRLGNLSVADWLRQKVDKPERFLQREMRLSPGGVGKALRGEPLDEGDVQVPDPRYSPSPWTEVVLVMPDGTGLALWNSYPTRYWNAYTDVVGVGRAMLARHGERALPGLVALLTVYPELGLTMARGVDSGDIVATALHALRTLKKAHAAAAHWLEDNATTALTAALPVAFGRGRAARDDARMGIRWLAARGHEADARRIAAEYGGAMPRALAALLDADPRLVTPTRIPKLPNFFVAASFRRPLLKTSNDALPTAAMEHVGTMLAMSKLDAPYPGIADVKEACTAASLAEFAWDLFDAWQAAGAPSKEGWAFTALGLLGDDETARRLAPCIREWPGESQHQRAVTGLDVLATIGSDVALMHLNGIAAKVKFKALQDRAKEKIAAVAEARGFTPAELADRLVPDLGLDERGTLELDFGPRRFFVGFDETLKPFVKDAQGARLKDLPKPIKSDDAALADAAVDRFKQMKKDAKAIASLQVMRLEMSMVERRRWSAADFRLFFLEHPLMRHLAARVVWGVYDAQGRVASAFRVAEDWTLADGEDTQTTLADDAQVGIAHVLEMPKPMQDAFGQVFADYEILQPFRQLGRETFTLTPDEAKASTITRFADKTVATGSVMGLINRGWKRGQAEDAGWVNRFSKPAGNGLEAEIELDPGTIVGEMNYEPKQRIPNISLRREGTWDKDGLVEFGQLDPIVASEVLRDVELLAPYKEP